MRGSISKTVTLVPNELKIEANSTPTAPAPTITRVFGTAGSFRISMLLSTVCPSISIPGSDRAAEPVPNMMCVASISEVCPSFSTVTFPGPAQRPQPCTLSTLFLRNRNSMPLACLLTTISLRASAAAQLSPKSFTSMPNSLEIFRVSKISAVCSSTLVGMQPTCRQVPPRKGSFSTTAVLSPHCAPRIAVLYPPGPLPMIARSYLAKCPPRQTGKSVPLTLRRFRWARWSECNPLDEVGVPPASALAPGSPSEESGGRTMKLCGLRRESALGF